MKNKGFTLIELLAVIVILAIIALIATPIILGIINDARLSSAERGAELVISNVDLAYSTAYMANNGNYPTLALVVENFEMDGAEMDSTGKITVDDENVTCETDTTSGLQVTCTANSKEFASKTMTLGTEASEETTVE